MAGTWQLHNDIDILVCRVMNYDVNYVVIMY